ncbi:MAG: hypothetical protein AAF092_04510 [Pseudomonadota bacterium]
MTSYLPNAARNSAEIHTLIPDDNGQHRRMCRFYDEVANRTASEWPGPKRKRTTLVNARFPTKGEHQPRVNPYKFAWPDEAFREVYLRWLMMKGPNCQYRARDALRFLLFRFGAAETAKVSGVPELRGYRWRYISNPEMDKYLGQCERDRRASLAYLIDHGLIEKVFVQGRTRFPYYRPSDDLFRICLKVTQLADKDYLRADGNGQCFPEETAAFKGALNQIFEDKAPELTAMCSDFVASEDADRAAVFCQQFQVWIDQYWPEWD